MANDEKNKVNPNPNEGDENQNPKNEDKAKDKSLGKKFLDVVTAPVRAAISVGNKVAGYAKDHPRMALTITSTVAGTVAWLGRGIYDSMKGKSYTQPMAVDTTFADEIPDVPEIPDIPDIPEIPDIPMEVPTETEE